MEKSILYIAIISSAFFCGCEQQPHNKPPVERIALTVRFFNSMAKHDSQAAVRQGTNIFNLDKSQNHVHTLVSIQESNEAISSAQKLVDAGRIDDALAVIEKARQLYPQNNALENARTKLRQLRNAPKLLMAMKNAKTFSSMSGARSAAETGLSQNLTPAMIELFRRYEEKEQLTAKRERQHTSNTLEAASSAAERAKAEDARREAENLRFMEEMERKSRESEQMRRDAGEVPFESEDKKDAKE